MSEKEEFTLPGRIESVDVAAMRADEFARKAGFDADFISAVDMALRESVANAVKHGNRLDESKTVEVTLEASGSRFEISVADSGSGFSPDEIPDPTANENLLKASGRGILFMRAFMDHVEWTDRPGGGTVVKMVKKL